MGRRTPQGLPHPILPAMAFKQLLATLSAALVASAALTKRVACPDGSSVADVQFRTSVQTVNPEPNREFGSRFVFGSCFSVSVRFAVQPYNLRFEQVRTDYSISARFVGFSVM